MTWHHPERASGQAVDTPAGAAYPREQGRGTRGGGRIMTEQEWMACTDPMPMLNFLRGRASNRQKGYSEW